MKPSSAAILVAALALAGCRQEAAEPPPPPAVLTADAVGNFCGMTLVEHPGPKGQILLAGRSQPVWFSSARDAIAFTLLPEEDKRIRAIYVSDMARTADWAQPGATNWTDARTAFFVIESRARSGMGTDETVPFSSRAAAERFAAANGGRIVAFSDVPRDYVLGSGGDLTGAAEEARPPVMDR